MSYVILNAIVKGCLEGFTEFLPISSTGHLILVRQFFPLTTNPEDLKRLDDLFDIVVQFPAVLAIVVLYRQRLWASVRELPARREPQRFWLGLFLAFLPAAVCGVLFHHYVEEVLMTPTVVAGALLVGGLVLLWADRRAGAEPITRAEDMPLGRAVLVGCCQALALIPGTSRSGATIVGGRFLGLTREAAAEYSFFLALPTMFGAFVYKFAQALPKIQWASDGPVLLAGSVASFLVAWLVVALFIRFLQKHSLAPFAWYRIVLGAAVLVWASR